MVNVYYSYYYAWSLLVFFWPSYGVVSCRGGSSGGKLPHWSQNIAICESLSNGKCVILIVGFSFFMMITDQIFFIKINQEIILYREVQIMVKCLILLKLEILLSKLMVNK